MADKEDPNLVTVRPVRRFKGVEGWKTPSSPPFEVTKQRAADLKASGLVEILAPPAAKKASAPENKKAPEPQNKAASGRDTKESEA